MKRGSRAGTRGAGPFLAAALVLGVAEPVHAHAFGQRFDLPVPLNFYLIGAGATVALSFAMIALFVRGRGGLETYPRYNLLGTRVGRSLAHPLLLSTLRVASVCIFSVALLAGFFGAQDPAHNVLPTLVWIIWWTGMAYVCALLGDLWALINPWRILFSWAEGLHGRLRPGVALGCAWPYPRRLGIWPACLAFLIFVWAELIWPTNAIPSHLAATALLYSIVTWGGMFLFGKEVWLRHGETFSVAFGLFARFAPLEIRTANAASCALCSASECRRTPGDCVNCQECFSRASSKDPTSAPCEWNLRPYGVGLLPREAISTSQMAFVLLMLATVTFDGFTATPLWKEIFKATETSRLVMPTLFELYKLGAGSDVSIPTLGLLAFPVLFLGVYLTFSLIISLVGGGSTPGHIARYFVLTLIPIAIAYHLAHYLAFLLTAGQLIIPLASDPFGSGWNLLGTADYRVNIGIVGARFVWYTAVTTIVLGHILAVYLAHVLALRVFATQRSALRSQYPMLVLMVLYTLASLWILAQPIVE